MILVVIFTISGAIAFLIGFAALAAGNFTVAALMVAAPVFLSSLALFGLAQVIHALVRTAVASEAAVQELKGIAQRIDAREAGDADRHATMERMAGVFDRLGQKKAEG